MSCCCHPKPEPPEPSEQPSGCCGGGSPTKKRPDWLLRGSVLIIAIGCLIHFISDESPADGVLAGAIFHFAHGVANLMGQMWWGILAGMAAVGFLHQLPREMVLKVLGRPSGASGIARAMAAGFLLDLCNHGIVLVGMKLYERGASLGQTFAFLVASPWNSFSLTLILIALIGWPLTLVFIAASGLIAFTTGCLIEWLVRRRIISERDRELPDMGAPLTWSEWGTRVVKALPFSRQGLLRVLRDGVSESRMVLRWIFFGIVLAALIRAVVHPEVFAQWFGPGLIGLMLTLTVATIIEVCSEGSTPLAADLVTRAAAPGNGFVFLMAGAATDYTEIMALKETTGRWLRALLLPLLTVPQILAIGHWLN